MRGFEAGDLTERHSGRPTLKVKNKEGRFVFNVNERLGSIRGGGGDVARFIGPDTCYDNGFGGYDDVEGV